jgi:D-alanyl-D-alanine carboxypeptidase
MEAIQQALNRVDQLQDRLGVHRAPTSFASILDANLGSSAEATVAPLSNSPVSAPFGAMLRGGSVIPVAPLPAAPGMAPVGGIVTTSELDAYLKDAVIRERNGHLVEADLMEVDGGWDGQAYLLPPAADAWNAMRAAAAGDGIDLRVVDTYRSWNAQAHGHNAYLSGQKDAYVAPPGRSEHGVGLAVDITNGSILDAGDHEWEWLQSNAARFGWHPISTEPWHWEFRGVQGGSAGG